MKKNKKQVFKNIWAKVKKPLMIISLIFNVLFFTILFVSCATTKKQTTQVKAEDISYSLDNFYTLRNSRWRFNESLNFNDVANQDIMGTIIGYADIHFTPNDEPFLTDDYTYYELGFFRYSRNTNWELKIFGENEGSTIPAINWATCQNGVITWNYSREIIIFSDKPSYYRTTGEDYENKSIIKWFFDNAELIEAPRSQFSFLSDFNYNAYDNITYNSYFIPKFWSSGVSGSHTLRYGFISSGKVWTNINLYFYDGTNKKYMKDGEILSNQGSNSAFYSYMEYYNSDTGERATVNVRKHGQIDDQTYIENGSNWVNDGYQYVYVFENRDGEDNLTRFNNNAMNYSGFVDYDLSTSGNVGLGGVFTLMKNAFSSLLPIFSIQILPNISIGLLFFMPLIVVVIVVVIKLVKR